MKPQQVPLNKRPSKEGKGITKKNDPCMSRKNITQYGLKGANEQIMFQLLPQLQEAYHKRKRKGTLKNNKPRKIFNYNDGMLQYRHDMCFLQRPSAYRNHIKFSKEDHWCLLLTMPCQHINEKKYSLINVENQKCLWQGGKMHLLGVNCGKFLFCSSHHHHGHSSLHEMKQNMKPNLLGIFMILGLTMSTSAKVQMPSVK